MRLYICIVHIYNVFILLHFASECLTPVRKGLLFWKQVSTNWNCLICSNSKIWKYSIFTFIFRVLDTNPLYSKTNQTYELLIGERQFDELCFNGLLIAKQNLGPNFNTKITVYWKSIGGLNQNIYIFPKWLPGMLNNHNFFHFYRAILAITKFFIQVLVFW